ncbi:MAG TPA: HAD family phosphatase [Flavisolibacter sp.]
MNISTINSIIFDLGGVLIDWNPAYVFDRLFDDEEKKRYFFEHICTSDWNEMQDEGRSLREATDSLVAEHPEWKEYIEAYYGRWEEMLGGPIPGTVEILRRLKEADRHRLYALTNWSAELFPIALQKYDFLHWFHGRVVSGEEKMRKPYPEFYQLTLDRFSLDPASTLFIDDNQRNIEGAARIGLVTLRFHSPEQLEQDLRSRNILDR